MWELNKIVNTYKKYFVLLSFIYSGSIYEAPTVYQGYARLQGYNREVESIVLPPMEQVT